MKALDRIDADEVAVVDTPPGNERLLAKAIERADVVVVPTRIGGVETARVEAVLDLVPRKLPVGLVISSARTYTRDYQDVVAAWTEADVAVWGSVPERVSIAAGPEGRARRPTASTRTARSGAAPCAPREADAVELDGDRDPRRSSTGPSRSTKLST